MDMSVVSSTRVAQLPCIADRTRHFASAGIVVILRMVPPMLVIRIEWPHVRVFLQCAALQFREDCLSGRHYFVHICFDFDVALTIRCSESGGRPLSQIQ